VTEENWRSIEELLTESRKTHVAECEWKGRKVKVAWKELEEADDVPGIGDGEALGFQDMTPADKAKFLRKLAEAELVARITKVGKYEGCLNDNILPMEVWKELPLRLRMQLISVVFEYDKELRESFLSQPSKT
jgi:hypothetical protein